MTADSRPLVSIVTPSYNQGQFLEATLLSVLQQDYPNIEYLVIDGGSTDNSLEILRKYSDRLAYWVSEPDGGQTAAILKGFERAQGQFLAWLCSDDLLEPSMVSISVDYHLRHPGTGLTYGDRVRIDRQGNTLGFSRFPAYPAWMARYRYNLPQETTLFSRAAYQKSGGLDPSLEMVMDFDLWCKLSRVAGVGHIPAYLARFRSHAGSKSVLFQQQIKTGAFASGFPAEYARIYQKHFGSRPPARMQQINAFLNLLLGFIQRRGKSYQAELRQIARVRAG